MAPSGGFGTPLTSPDSTPSSYVVRGLIDNVPLSTGENDQESYITCVDAWNGNLYIGTSAGEVLHYVSIPPDPNDNNAQPSYIFATKLEPPYSTEQTEGDRGIKQILLLPDPDGAGEKSGKACVLCNGTLTFYTLPELSPAFGGQIKQSGCNWIGGLDLEPIQDAAEENGTSVIICLKQRLRLIRIGKEARKVRDIELGGVNAIQRRRDLACVADGMIYALLDVVNQRKNDLFPISSIAREEQPQDKLQSRLRPSSHRAGSRSVSSTTPGKHMPSHDRNVSMGGVPRDNSQLQPGASSAWPARGSSRKTLEPSTQLSGRGESPFGSEAPSPRASSEILRPVSDPPPSTVRLSPNIASSNSGGFLLTTGTQLSEPGVGIFVDMEGEPCRGTIEFSSYPQSLVIDTGDECGLQEAVTKSHSEHVLAIVHKRVDGLLHRMVEIQILRAEFDEGDMEKEWITIDAVDEQSTYQRGVGLRTAVSITELIVPSIATNLRLRRLKLRTAEHDPAEQKRNDEEDGFAARFSRINANVLLYAQDKVSWVTRNPLITRLEEQLDSAVIQGEAPNLSIDKHAVQRVINGIRGQEARTELEFVTLTYVRQKASLLLVGHLLLQSTSGAIAYAHDKRYAEEALVAGGVDPRVVLSLLPELDDEVEEGEHGIWLAQGLRDTASMLRMQVAQEALMHHSRAAYSENLLPIAKRYLFAWRKKKGFGSVADEQHVFRTVDAALLRILLMLDQVSSPGPAAPGSIRAELNDVVDHGVDCFERAVALFQDSHRLYTLSRLYQSRKMAPEVLATWKRILEGEEDAGGELVDGEQDMRRYLAKIRDRGLVLEYGAWLARRDSHLGVQVFADDGARVKFEPAEAVALLRERAPHAVKDYLEHLVFGRNHTQYVNELMSFYLDAVVHELETSADAKQMLLESYTTYRALQPPKPTYRNFITDNAPTPRQAEWLHSRLRLLQLIEGSHSSDYHVQALRERLAPYSDLLVPEMVILNGRECKHEEALRLLTHGLGDYDTAVRYCILGGSSIFFPASAVNEPARPSTEEQSRLLYHLLHCYLSLPSPSEREERTSELLTRLGAWFDLREVLDTIPEDWGVDLLAGFLTRGLRSLLVERHETGIVKALSGAQNLRSCVDFAEKMERFGPTVVTEEENGIPAVDREGGG